MWWYGNDTMLSCSTFFCLLIFSICMLFSQCFGVSLIILKLWLFNFMDYIVFESTFYMCVHCVCIRVYVCIIISLKNITVKHYTTLCTNLIFLFIFGCMKILVNSIKKSYHIYSLELQEGDILWVFVWLFYQYLVCTESNSRYLLLIALHWSCPSKDGQWSCLCFKGSSRGN